MGKDNSVKKKKKEMDSTRRVPRMIENAFSVSPYLHIIMFRSRFMF